jgi:hypothetical protein
VPGDLADARAMLERGLVTCAALRAALAQMEPRLERYPRVSGPELRHRLEELCPPREVP